MVKGEDVLGGCRSQSSLMLLLSLLLLCCCRYAVYAVTTVDFVVVVSVVVIVGIVVISIVVLVVVVLVVVAVVVSVVVVSVVVVFVDVNVVVVVVISRRCCRPGVLSIMSKQQAVDYISYYLLVTSCRNQQPSLSRRRRARCRTSMSDDNGLLLSRYMRRNFSSVMSNSSR